MASDLNKCCEQLKLITNNTAYVNSKYGNDCTGKLGNPLYRFSSIQGVITKIKCKKLNNEEWCIVVQEGDNKGFYATDINLYITSDCNAIIEGPTKIGKDGVVVFNNINLSAFQSPAIYGKENANISFRNTDSIVLDFPTAVLLDGDVGCNSFNSIFLALDTTSRNGELLRLIHGKNGASWIGKNNTMGLISSNAKNSQITIFGFVGNDSSFQETGSFVSIGDVPILTNIIDKINPIKKVDTETFIKEITLREENIEENIEEIDSNDLKIENNGSDHIILDKTVDTIVYNEISIAIAENTNLYNHLLDNIIFSTSAINDTLILVSMINSGITGNVTINTEVANSYLYRTIGQSSAKLNINTTNIQKLPNTTTPDSNSSDVAFSFNNNNGTQATSGGLQLAMRYITASNNDDPNSNEGILISYDDYTIVGNVNNSSLVLRIPDFGNNVNVNGKLYVFRKIGNDANELKVLAWNSQVNIFDEFIVDYVLDLRNVNGIWVDF
jgi:hypothetical protein